MSSLKKCASHGVALRRRKRRWRRNNSASANSKKRATLLAARRRVTVRSSLVIAVFRLEKVNQQIERHPVGRMSNFKTADNRTKSLVMVCRQREVEPARVSELSLTGSLAHLSRRRKSLRSFNKPSIESERSTRPSSTHMQPCFARLMTCGTRNGWL